MELLPDLASLSDVDLKRLIQELQDEEREVSYRRRLLHGKIDILRAERGLRAQRRGEGDEPGHVEIDRLRDILAENLIWKRQEQQEGL